MSLELTRIAPPTPVSFAWDPVPSPSVSVRPEMRRSPEPETEKIRDSDIPSAAVFPEIDSSSAPGPVMVTGPPVTGSWPVAR